MGLNFSQGWQEAGSMLKQGGWESLVKDRLKGDPEGWIASQCCRADSKGWEQAPESWQEQL